MTIALARVGMSVDIEKSVLCDVEEKHSISIWIFRNGNVPSFFGSIKLLIHFRVLNVGTPSLQEVWGEISFGC
jgi:hypothetical protein